MHNHSTRRFSGHFFGLMFVSQCHTTTLLLRLFSAKPVHRVAEMSSNPVFCDSTRPDTPNFPPEPTGRVMARSPRKVNAFLCCHIPTRNSSGDEIANVNFLYDGIVHVLQNTIDSCIPPQIDAAVMCGTHVYQIQ